MARAGRLVPPRLWNRKLPSVGDCAVLLLGNVFTVVLLETGIVEILSEQVGSVFAAWAGWC